MKTFQEIRTVNCKSGSISYTLLRKNVKNINLRVSCKNGVTVSANKGLSYEYLDSFVKSKEKFILKALETFVKLKIFSIDELKYENGEEVLLYGKTLTLKIIKSEKQEASVTEDIITLAVLNADSFEEKKTLFEKFWLNLCRENFFPISDKVYADFEILGIKKPIIKIKKMKSRWGSCMPSKGIITLNSLLLQAPIPAVEYVVLHEYCHLIHPNHSKNFYDFLSIYLPNWKEQKAVLKNITL